MRCHLYKAIVSAVTFVSVHSYGQTPVKSTLTEAKEVTLKSDDLKTGWSDLHSISGGTNFIKQENIRGQQDGDSSIYSLNLSNTLGYKSGQHHWANSLTVQEAFSQTPAIDRMIKSTDTVDLISFYRFHFTPQSSFGSYTRLKGSTAAFDSFVEKASEVDFVVERLDGSVAKTVRSDRLRIASGFAPQEYKESLGVFATLWDQEYLHFDLRTGPASKQFFARGTLVVNDKKDTAEIELKELNSNSSVGLEAALEASGALLQKKMDYKVSVESLYPIDYTPVVEPRLPNSKLVSYDASFQLRYNIADWLALSYNLRSRRDPLVRAQAEVLQNTMLTATLRKSFL